MKKIFLFSLILLMVLSFTSIVTATPATINTPENYYREHYKDSLSQKDINLLIKNGFLAVGNELTTPDGDIYFYPVIINNFVYYMDANSYLYKYELTKFGYEVLVDTCIHCNCLDEITMSESIDGKLTFNSKTSIISLWVMQEKIKSWELPIDSIYAGESSTEGYIFRNNSNVYTFVKNNSDMLTCYVNKIVSDVELVIITDYGWTSTYYSQPLLKMNNGDIQVYCSSLKKNNNNLYSITEDGERTP